MSDGRSRPCQRNTCAGEPAHLGGEHIDPRSPRYDGPSITINALGATERKAAYALIAAGAPVPEVVALVEEIHRLGRQVAAVRVDKDRQVRAASERALDCTEHGQIIKATEAQVARLDDAARRNDEARVALLAVLFDLEEAVAVLRRDAKLGRPLPGPAKIVDVIGEWLDKATKAHERAWRKPEAKGRKAKAGVSS